MTLDRSLEGKRYPPVRFTLDPERVEAFARAVAHHASGVPPTIVTVPELEGGLSNVVTDPSLGVSLSQILHGEQEYEWHRAMSVGETLIAETSIESIRGRGAMSFATLRTDVRDPSGEPVATARTTLVVREVP